MQQFQTKKMTSEDTNIHDQVRVLKPEIKTSESYQHSQNNYLSESSGITKSEIKIVQETELIFFASCPVELFHFVVSKMTFDSA